LISASCDSINECSWELLNGKLINDLPKDIIDLFEIKAHSNQNKINYDQAIITWDWFDFDELIGYGISKNEILNRFHNSENIIKTIMTINLNGVGVNEILILTKSKEKFLSFQIESRIPIKIIDLSNRIPLTFSSLVIESRFDEINEIKDNFLYLNDDFLLGMENNYIMKVWIDTSVCDCYHNLVTNTLLIYFKTFNIKHMMIPTHKPYRLRKNTIKLVNDRIKGNLIKLRKHTFRRNLDDFIPIYLYILYEIDFNEVKYQLFDNENLIDNNFEDFIKSSNLNSVCLQNS